VPGGRREGDTETDGRKKKETKQKHIPERKGVCLLFGFRTFADFLLSFVAFLLSWRSPHKRLDCYRWLPGRIFRPSDTFHFLASFLTKYTPHTYRQPPKIAQTQWYCTHGEHGEGPEARMDQYLRIFSGTLAQSCPACVLGFHSHASLSPSPKHIHKQAQRPPTNKQEKDNLFAAGRTLETS